MLVTNVVGTLSTADDPDIRHSIAAQSHQQSGEVDAARDGRDVSHRSSAAAIDQHVRSAGNHPNPLHYHLPHRLRSHRPPDVDDIKQQFRHDRGHCDVKLDPVADQSHPGGNPHGSAQDGAVRVDAAAAGVTPGADWRAAAGLPQAGRSLPQSTHGHRAVQAAKSYRTGQQVQRQIRFDDEPRNVVVCLSKIRFSYFCTFRSFAQMFVGIGF